MKKIIKKMLAVCLAATAAVSAASVCVSAEYVPNIGTNSTYSLAAIDSGTYYSTSNPGSFIKIYSRGSECMVYLVVDSGGQRICGNGTYNYYLGMDEVTHMNLVIDSWHYENDPSIIDSPSVIKAVYDGNITLLYNGEVFSK